MSEFDNALAKAKIGIMFRDDLVFFSSMMLGLKFIEAHDIPTAATDGRNMWLNPKFFLALTPDERIFLIMHEVYHVILLHMTRRGHRDARVWNAAADYAINGELTELGLKMPKDGLYDKKYVGMLSEDIYDQLIEDPNNQNQSPWEDLVEGGGPSDGDDEQDDSSGNTPPPPSPEQQQKDQQELEQEIQQKMLEAEVRAQSQKDPGHIPAHIQRYLDSLKNPKLNWKLLLRRFLFARAKTKRTYQKLNRRFPDVIMPTRFGESMGRVAVVVDTSGSVSKSQFDQFITETYSILQTMKPKQIDLIQFSYGITAIDEVRNKSDFARVKFTGGGGTEIREVYDWMEQHNPALVVAFTDGYFQDYAKPTKAPWLWMINDNPHCTMNWGRTIHFDPE